jgi:hypothetical protein
MQISTLAGAPRSKNPGGIRYNGTLRAWRGRPSFVPSKAQSERGRAKRSRP